MCVGLHVSFYWQYDTFLFHSFTFNSKIIIPKRKLLTAMPVYRRVCRCFLLFHLIVLTAVYTHDICTFSLLKLVQDSGNLAMNIQLHDCFKRTQHNVNSKKTNWSLRMVFSLAFTIFSYWQMCSLLWTIFYGISVATVTTLIFPRLSTFLLIFMNMQM